MRKSMGRFLRAAALAIFVAHVAFASLAVAQESIPFGITDEEEYQNAFRALLAAPSDESALARYANAATRVGNLESAIATLERILALNPDLDAVRYELAVLYARIRSPEFARVQLELARDSASASPELRGRAERLLARLDAQDRLGVLTGTLGFGLRYQTNANAGTDSSVIREGGFDFPTPPDRREEEDVNAFAFAALSHIYDLGLESRVPLETHAATYWTRQVDVDDIDLGIVELTSGPRLPLLTGTLDRVSIRPFGLFGFSLLDDEWNSTDYGGGIDFEKRIGLHSAMTLTYTARQREFDVESDRDGITHKISGAAILSITTDIAAAVGGSFADEDADADFNSNQEVSAFVRGTIRYDAPFDLTWPWQASLQFRWIGTYDEAPDDRVDPFVEREDDEYEVIARNTFWLSSQLAVFVEGSYLRAESN
ncbi:MAG: tetratricopeptide repeat protein, partial [Candidatus Binatia bacterium]